MDKEKWELCIFGLENVVFYSPENGTSVFTINDFVNKFIDSRTKGTKNISPSSIVIPWILNNGWEPYASIPGAYYFRRRITRA